MSVPTPFFPRGSGPLVSVLIPTRGRVDSLEEAVISCVINAYNPANLEFVLKVDDDDLETLEAADGLRRQLKPASVIVITTPRGTGYPDLHRYVNEAAAHARGDWLFLFNDDARILTPKWDLALQYRLPFDAVPGITDSFLMLFERGSPQDSFYCFSAIRRKAFEIMGHYALAPQCDAWVYTVFSLLRAVTTVDVKVQHDHSLARQETAKGKRVVAGIEEQFASLTASRQRLEDAAKLLGHMEQVSVDRIWLDRPRRLGWHWWKCADQEEPCLVEASSPDLVAWRYSPQHGKQGSLVRDMGGVWSTLR